MEQYIPKSALVAEIERWIKHYNESAKEFGDEGCNDNVLMEQCKANACKHILSFIDTLEVKEVDLEKYYHEFLQKEWFGNSHVRTVSEMMAFTARHFFELGLKAQKGEETVIPEDKMKRYMEWCQGKTSTVLCACGKIVEVTLTPYFYDEDNNDVYFASLCPECGKLIITKE